MPLYEVKVQREVIETWTAVIEAPSKARAKGKYSEFGFWEEASLEESDPCDEIVLSAILYED